MVSEVKDKKFTAKINIQCDHLISNASISVGYDDSLVEFEKCETNDKAGGMAKIGRASCRERVFITV